LSPLAGCQLVHDWWYPEAEEEVSPWLAHAIAYSVNFIGDFPEDLTNQLRDVSHLVTLQEKQPLISLIALRRRANVDVKNLTILLKAQGYLDATVTADIEGEESPYTVNVTLIAGERYHISDISFHNRQSQSPIQVQPADLLHWVHLGEVVETQTILTLQQSLMLYLQEHGYPGAHVEEPKILANRCEKTVSVHVDYNPGHLSEFGSCEIIGLKSLDVSYINNRLAWQEGQTYDQRLVEETRRKLINSAIFDSVIIHPQDPQLATTPMVVQLTEAPPRVIGAGLRYFSSEGFGAKIFWRHYNTLGGGELVDTSVQLSQLFTQLRLGVSFPDVLAPEQQLQTLFALTRERTKAYNARTAETEIKIQRPLTKNIAGSVGLLFEVGQVERGSQHTSEQLFGLPLEAAIDTADNPLDPHSGWRSRLTFVPYGCGHIGNERKMFITRFQGKGYLPFSDRVDTPVLAVWANVGSIHIGNPNNVPPNKRFYAGGGGSVRSYGYQRLGPIDENGIPLGGRSITEGGIEGRFRFTETWGGAVFFEGGAVSNNRSPLVKARFLWGPGVGVRYYTAIGPIRFDVAVPLKRRQRSGQKSIDSPFQFYISIGQAF
ncbi:MAG: BamA/TamA family outer membrane protein, partial [Alphaproteobacteria bacterium]